MAFDAFLKLDGVPGESVDDKHKGEIEILSFSWGVSNPGSFAFGGGGGAGKATFSDVTFESATQSSSPLLAAFTANGKHIASALLTLRKAGQQRTEFVKITMSPVIVSSYNQAGFGNGDRPFDTFALTWSEIEFDYFPQAADGSAGTPIVFHWDAAANKG